MSSSTAAIQPVHFTLFDDELAALTLQLEEIEQRERTGKGKHPVDHPPDIEVAFTCFMTEIQSYKTFLDDQKLAHSIAAAVHSDGLLIDNLTFQDVRAHEDWGFASALSNNDLDLEPTPPFVHITTKVESQASMSTTPGDSNNAYHSVLSDVESNEDHSMTYTERQAELMKKFSMELHCIACTDDFPRSFMIALQCNHRYCANCVKRLFMHSTTIESLYPPRCCRHPIPLAKVAKHMEPKELATFELAVVEYKTQNRTYCSNSNCGVLIVPDNIEPGANRAKCTECGTDTCAICKNRFHDRNDCPDDPSLKQTRELARTMGWQTCFACKRLVQHRSGCNHMTCLCGAQFCYVCGTRWKQCKCATADLNRIMERA